MFYKISILKKMMKEAYKGMGLHVGQTVTGWLVIRTGHWELCQDFETVPKEVKGAIMELTGEIPLKGTFYKAVDKECNQYELEADVRMLPLRYPEIDKGEEGEITRILMVGVFDIYAVATVYDKGEGYTVLLKQNQAQLVTPEGIEVEAGETPIYGPYIGGRREIIWHNSDTWYCTAPVIPEKDRTDTLKLYNDIAKMCGNTALK
ncbi:MAG: hypothetical protein IJ608_02755 [Lachnospiraceae bacterium]|nr:hypothetical protein [Lachnospiraceae bacterium]